MKRKIVIVGVLTLIQVLGMWGLGPVPNPQSPVPAFAVPDDADFIRCARACTRDCTFCLQGCDILDDSCWDYCFQLYMICVMGCPGSGIIGVGIPH